MTDVDDVVPLASKGTGVGKRSVNEILVTGQNSDEVGFLDEIPVADPKPADEGICISRVTVATVGRDVVIVPDDPECSIRVVQDGLGVVLGKYSVEQICDAQSKDPEFKWLTEWLDDNSCQPAQGDLFRSSQPAKFYWTIKERFSRDERGMIMDRELPVWVNRAIEELQNGGVAQAMQPNNPVTPSQDNVQDPVRVDQKRRMSSDEGSSGGSPKRSWAAEEKKEQREVSPRGRHHDRVPSVERVVPSQVDAKGQDGEFEAKVPGKDISGDHRDSSPKARDTGSGLVRGTRDGSHDSRARSGSREDRVRDPSGGRSRCSVSRSTPGAAVPMARDTPVGIPTDRDAHSAPPLGRGFQGRKETTQERKRRRSRQKERQAEETARLQRALREAQQRRTPNSFQGGGRRDTGVSWQRTPQHNYTPTGTGGVRTEDTPEV
ncbi:unnamed protein product [Mytilus edulis]|uniref:Uncharacterized protein n=1 Tax=Mytilus edulis TaxID=6550 RepID=A0A8S3TZL2_MYTED|nr:unnamed protein product [Mytilus edulis]